MSATRIIWLASYPKSGNTWLRFLLHNYLYGEVTESAEVERRIPDAHGLGEVEEPATEGPLLCKTHRALGPDHPEVKRTAGFVYVLRHPRDVLLSNLNYVRMLAKEGEAFSDQAFALTFIRHMGSPLWRERGMGNWPEHVASWLGAASQVPHVVLRYEDMKRDPGEGLSRVLRMLGEPVDPERLAKAVEASAFEKMRDLEAREREAGTHSIVFTITDDSLKHDLRFMRRGESHQSLAHLGPEVEAAFQARFAEVLHLFGY